MTHRTWFQREAYKAIRMAMRTLALITGCRYRGRRHMPAAGPVIVCANHQSYLDPVLVGMTFNRRLNYLARANLFRFPLRGLIRFLDAIPLDRDGLGMSGMKETLRRLRRGEIVLVFPEGTRTADGELGPLHPGICGLARRGRAALLPVGLDGAFDAWPRHRKSPRWARIEVQVGPPMSAELCRSLSNEELLEELSGRMQRCLRQAQRFRRRVC